GHDKATLRLLDGLARGEVSRAAGKPRLRPGTVLMREHGGGRHTVTVAPDGFVWQDRTYSSLSAVARPITGTSWHGRRFFGLRDRVGAGPCLQTRRGRPFAARSTPVNPPNIISISSSIPSTPSARPAKPTSKARPTRAGGWSAHTMMTAAYPVLPST